MMLIMAIASIIGICSIAAILLMPSVSQQEKEFDFLDQREFVKFFRQLETSIKQEAAFNFLKH